MAEHGETDTPNVVDGKYTCDQVYWIPVDESGVILLTDAEIEVQEYIRFTVLAGCTVEEGDEYLEDVVGNVLGLTLAEFKEAFGFEDEE